MAFSLRRARTTAALTASLALAALLGVAPAQAHDALASTSPTDGQTIATNPGKVSITLTNPPTTGIPGSNILTVTAPDGHVVSSGEVTVEGKTLSTDADIDHDGKHTVEWRAVSADGHPIEGTFSFTYAPEGEATEAPSATATSSAPAAAAPETLAVATQAAADPASQTQPADGTGWLIGAGVIVAALAAGLVYLMRRRNKAGTSA
ncbi:copper resistance protein CopC [Pseudarthrobacter oxydans]|jgi:methionine-rich copper-binding protein CopC|uniref:copper resistance CopC family protein n=1 Tax=Pseudarthrobacter oxydans TaxID=1671 RepID=UPI00157199A1|nr:copper resistance CopC family protein [Pseudarthrobacter oxydans]MDZ4351642.1 copper resistance protein CopC [Arthrobacter sp.]NSX36475.1 copper resistance protein CopC [Pseudarthrobacter oxydans]